MAKTILKEGDVQTLKYERKNSNDLNVSSYYSSNECFSLQEKCDSSVSVIEGAKTEDVESLTHTYCLHDNEGNKINRDQYCDNKYKSLKYDGLQNTFFSSYDDRQLDDITQREDTFLDDNEILSIVSDKLDLKYKTTKQESESSLVYHLSQSLNELEDINHTEMNFLRNRFQRSTSYDHERSRSSTRGSSTLSNNTDRLLKDIRSKRIRASSAAQSVSNNVMSSVFNRENSSSITDIDKSSSFDHETTLDTNTSRFLSKPIRSSPKPISYTNSNTRHSADLLTSNIAYPTSQTYTNDQPFHSHLTYAERSNTQKTNNLMGMSYDYHNTNLTSTESLSSPPTKLSLETENAITPKWYVEYQNNKEAEGIERCSNISKPRPYNRSKLMSFDEEHIISHNANDNQSNATVEEYSISVQLVLNKNANFNKDQCDQPEKLQNSIDSNIQPPCEISKPSKETPGQEMNGDLSNEGSFRRRRRPENRMESNESNSNPESFRRRRRQQETKAADTKSIDVSHSSSFRRRRRQEDTEGSDDGNPFTKRNFNSEKRKSFDNSEEIPALLKSSSSHHSRCVNEEVKPQAVPISSPIIEPVCSTASRSKEHNEFQSGPKQVEEKQCNVPVVSTKVEVPEPLNCIEIKSAAQWKAMSELMTWNFESVAEEQEQDLQCISESTSKYEDHKIPKPIEINKDDKSRSITYKLPPYDKSSDPVGFTQAEAKQLRLICWRIKPWKETKNRKLFSSQFAEQWGVDCDEVYQGLFIGDKASAASIKFLKRYGITHVLNTAEGKDEGLVDLSSSYFEGSGITYLGFPLWDTPSCNLLPYFGCASEFIDNAISSGGKCLVNCQMGVSRSASCAIPYLMIKEGMSAKDALTLFRKSRDCRPNDGFLDQLIELDNDLRRFRDYDIPMRITLSTLHDLPLLPQPWNFEFWTKPMSEEEIGMTLVNIGETFIPKDILNHLAIDESPVEASRNLSRRTSREVSRKSSKRNSFRLPDDASISPHYYKNNIKEKSMDHSKVPSNKNSRPISQQVSVADTVGGDTESDWEWVWEDENGNEIPIDEFKEENAEIKERTEDPQINSEPSILTIQKLEEVKEIIEKPEERWRTMWRKSLDSCAPSREGAASISSINSVLSSTSLAFSNQHSKKRDNLIQAGIDKSDPLSLVKVASAKQWKAISKNLTINFNDIELEDDDSKNILEEVPDTTEVGSYKSLLSNKSATEERPATPESFIPTKVQQLRLICWKIKPWEYAKEKNLFHSLLGAGWGVDCDEVYPNIFIGDEASARNIKFLQKMGITHVLNTAEGIWTDCSFVDLTDEYYATTGVTYQGLQLWDHTCVKILPYLGCANEFIASGINSGGRVLVHCQMGVSRSSTAAIAYMMITLDWTANDVLRLFRKRRDVRPNDFYLTQLVELDNDLRKLRECGVPRQINLHQLKDIDHLPKPWHYQFWESMPTDETLPFSLSCVCEPRPDIETLLRKSPTKKIYGICPLGQDCKAKPQHAMTIQKGKSCINNNKDAIICNGYETPLPKRTHKYSPSQSKRQSTCSTNSNGTCSWEWEYYDDSDQLQEDYDDVELNSNSNEILEENKIFSCLNYLKHED